MPGADLIDPRTASGKMNLPVLVENVMMKLGNIPGLTFLHHWVTDFYGKQTEFEQSIDDYFGYARSAREAAGDVRGAVGGPKKKDQGQALEDKDQAVEEEEEEEFEDDFESYMQ
jgi:hypothetical protein